ncbi:MAG: methionine synthase [Actinobacteria bacterium]|nr:MAG: methionine synthase [Actinomycetota bacterium]
MLGDIGPTGLVLAPLGGAAFDEVFEVFAEQAAALASAGPDALIIETMTDIAEARCALLAARSVTDLPVFVTVTFGANGRTDLSGTGPEEAAIVLEACGAAAVGINCGLGPEQMLPLVERLARACSVPVVVQPNAGLPVLDADGNTVFPGTPDEMGAYAARFVDAGASVVGSCCGSSPAFTGAIADFAKERAVAPRETPAGVGFAGPRGWVRVGAGRPIAVIGERINPTGKPELADSLREGSMSVVRRFAAEQADAGAAALDVNVGAAGVDAAEALPAAALALAGVTDLPLVLDTTDPAALERALRVYPGRALVNSVNGGEESMAAVLPLAARYGAAVVVLALDDAGIPHEAAGRLAIVDRVCARAHEAGLRDEDLIVDTLVMTAATDAGAPRVTVAALAGVKERGLAAMLGVSNVSHGLPLRGRLNAAFLAAAAEAGLDAAIVNPGDPVVAEAVRLADKARAAGAGAARPGQAWAAWDDAYEAALAGAHGGGEPGDAGADDDGGAVEARLAAAVLRGDADAAPGLVDAAVAAGAAPGDVIAGVLTPAIQGLGDAFGRGEAFLPQLIVAAEAMKAAVARAKTYLPPGASEPAGRVAFATVKGDVHSIGKDICISLLESAGFAVADLGVDVPPEAVAAAAADADVVCLSALMTTTLPAMQASAWAVEAASPGVPVLVGGAVVTEDWAHSMGLGYAHDAPGCVRAVEAAVAAVRSARDGRSRS